MFPRPAADPWPDPGDRPSLAEAAARLRADSLSVCRVLADSPISERFLGGLFADDQIDGDGLAGLSEPELADLVGDLAAVVERAETALAFAVEASESRSVPTAAGVLSTRGWVRHHQNITDRRAGRRVAWARFVRAHRATAEALACGQITHAHLEVICAAVPAELGSLYAEHETSIVEAARQLTPDGLRTVMAHWRHLADQDRADRDTRRGHERRHLGGALGLDGFVRLWGSLDAEAWATLCSVLDRLHPPDPVGGDVPPRSLGQRRADALADLADLANQRHLDDEGSDGSDPVGSGTPDPDDPTPSSRCRPKRTRPPHATITAAVDLATLTRGPLDLRSARCGIDGLGPAARATIERLCCDSPIARVVMATPSHPLDLGHSARFFSDQQRAALVLRDGGCAFPGCDRPPSWCVCHHISPWPDGPTDLVNGCLLCRRHHTLVHEGGWTIRVVDDARLFIPPWRTTPANAPPDWPQRR